MAKKGLILAALAVAGGALGAVALRVGAFNAPVNVGPALAALGSPEQCSRYSGLPPQWGGDRHAGMVHLASGRFVFGTTLGYQDERPADTGKVAVAGFWIDQTEVTNQQFAAFVAATAYVTTAERDGGAVVFHKPDYAELKTRPYAWWSYVQGADWNHPTGPGSDRKGLDNQPVTLVTQADALAYAHWLGRDLPTEAEWEYAAKAGHQDAKLDEAPRDAAGKPTANYWQGSFPVLNTGADGHEGLAPVGCYAANDWKLYDMIGNAWEWTADPYSGPHQGHANGDTASVAAASRTGRPGQPMVIKGGSFLCSQDFCVRYRASAREAQEDNLPASHIGFRTVLRG